VRLDHDNLCLGCHTPEHPASRRTFQGNTPKTGIDALDDRGPVWALNQRLAAMTIRDLYNEGKGVFVLPFPSEYVHETRSGYEKESRGIWKRKEAGSQGGYLSGI